MEGGSSEGRSESFRCFVAFILIFSNCRLDWNDDVRRHARLSTSTLLASGLVDHVVIDVASGFVVA